jgi:hypothetical protein
MKTVIEEDQKQNNTRKMYQTINQFKKGYQHEFMMLGNFTQRCEMEEERNNIGRYLDT